MLKSLITRFKTFIQRVKLYDERRQRNGKIWFKGKWIYFKSHTDANAGRFLNTGEKYKAIKCEALKKLDAKDVNKFSLTFCVDKWIAYGLERDSGTFSGGKLKGGFAIIAQLHNGPYPPVAYLTVRRKRADDGKLELNSFDLMIQTRGDKSTKTLFTTEIKLGEEVNVEFEGSPDYFKYKINGKDYLYNKPYLNSIDESLNLQFGLYWDGNIYKSIGYAEATKRDLGMVIKFKDLEF